MSKERFIALVKNPALLKAEDAPFLEELLREFPYFQSAHLLAARCYKVADSIHLQKQIKNAAAHITDRRVLYNLIENFETPIELSHREPAKEKNVPAPVVEEIVASAVEAVEEKEVRQEAIDQLIPAEEITLDEQPPSVAQEMPEVIVDTATQDLLIEVKENEEPELQRIDENQEVVEPESAELTNSEASSKVNIEEIPLEREIKLALAESIYLHEFEQNLPVNDLISGKKDVFNQQLEEIAEKATEKQEIKEEKEIPVKKEVRGSDFVTWLKNLQTNPNPAPDLTGNPAENKAPNESEKLVEAFMEKPMQRTKPVKQEFFSPVNMAKQSVTDNDFFVTETLAKIYIKQGNLTKAIKVYQNLSLKNPEKNTFFAAQIKILKEQLHNKSGK